MACLWAFAGWRAILVMHVRAAWRGLGLVRVVEALVVTFVAFVAFVIDMDFDRRRRPDGTGLTSQAGSPQCFMHNLFPAGKPRPALLATGEKRSLLSPRAERVCVRVRVRCCFVCG